MTSGSSSMARMILSDSGGLMLSSREGMVATRVTRAASVPGERHRESRADPVGTLHRDISAQDLGEATLIDRPRPVPPYCRVVLLST